MDVDNSQRLSFYSSMVQLVIESRTPNVLLGGMSRRFCCAVLLCAGALLGRNRDKQVTISFFEWPGSVAEGCSVSWLY